jgi:hypothetical protein
MRQRLHRFFNRARSRAWLLTVPDLIARIEEYLKAHNAESTKFVWTATAEHILAKVRPRSSTLATVDRT